MPVNETNAVSEATLISECARGSEKYCRLLFEKYYGRMLNVCRRYARDRDEAWDMLQEGFIRVFKNLRQFDGRGSFEGWIRRIMVTSSINYLKKFHQNGSVDYVDREVLASMESAETSSVYNVHSSSEANAEALLKLVQQLPTVYRMVFNLYAIEGYSHAEIATMLSINESTSRSNLAKARQKLQSRMSARSTDNQIKIAK